MSFSKIWSPPLLYANIILHFWFLFLILKSLFKSLVFKTVSGWPVPWNLTFIPKLRLHGNIFSFKVTSSHSFSKGSELNRTTSFIWSFLSPVVAVLRFSRFSYMPFSFLPVSSSLQISTTQVVGSKVLYTRKYYTRVKKFHLAFHRPQFVHNTQEKALYKKHLSW